MRSHEGKPINNWFKLECCLRNVSVLERNGGTIIPSYISIRLFGREQKKSLLGSHMMKLPRNLSPNTPTLSICSSAFSHNLTLVTPALANGAISLLWLRWRIDVPLWPLSTLSKKSGKPKIHNSLKRLWIELRSEIAIEKTRRHWGKSTLLPRYHNFSWLRSHIPIQTVFCGNILLRIVEKTAKIRIRKKSRDCSGAVSRTKRTHLWKEGCFRWSCNNFMK